MASFTLDEHRLRIEVVPAKGHTVHGGQAAVAAICRRFGLWDLLRAEPALDPRTDKRRGFAPETMVAQIVVALCCGGAGLADAARLQADKGLRHALGVKRFASDNQLSTWLGELGEPGVAALRRVLREFVRRLLAQCPAGAVRSGGELEVFFDDTQIEVTGRRFEGAAFNYEGNLALGLQALFVGPFLADQRVTGDNTPVSALLPEFLQDNAPLWQDTPAYFFADSASSEGRYLDAVRATFPRFSISYNRWTEPLERLAAELPAQAWTEREGSHYAYLRHQPEGCARPQVYAVRRWRDQGELFDRYSFCACEDGTRTPQAVWDRHDLKGEREQLFSQLLADLDLHHPPCLQLCANRAFYTLAALAFNALTALKLLELPAELHGWRIRTLIAHLLTLPAKLSRHARGELLRLFAPAGWLDWWRLWGQRYGTLAPA
jgi:hypothetical protein